MVPEGVRRFSMTCRTILPHMMASEEDREDARIKGAMPADCARYAYDGQ